MRREKSNRPKGAVLIPAALAVLCLISALAPGDAVLFRVDRADLGRIPAADVAGLFVVQELQTAILAVGPASFPERLAAAGFGTEILDREIEGKSYFLVRSLRPEDATALGRFGTAVPVEEGTALFWSEFGDAREVLPASIKVKRLDLDRAVAWTADVELRKDDAGLLETAVPDPRIFDWVAQVSKARLTETIQTLQNFQTRYSSTVACENAGTFLHDAFVQLGLACEYETFTFSSSQYQTRNIVAVLPGQSVPDKIVVVCAHYDSISNNPKNLAPGADDNASGTAAVLEIARVLVSAPFDYTVKFICFSAEEWGLYGSRHYAQRAKSRGENIAGVVNMDMIAYTDSANPILEVYVNPASAWLGNRYLEAAATYAPLSVSRITDSSATWSDHSPFWDQGYSALCAIEEAVDRNPHYHRTTDTLDKLNMNYCLSVTRASLAAVADLARPYVDRPAPPTGLEARSQVAGSLFSAVKTVSLKWDAGPERVAGYNVYRTTTPGSGHVKVNAGLLAQPLYSESMLNPGTAYYYVVTAVDEQGRESEYSEEVRDD